VKEGNALTRPVDRKRKHNQVRGSENTFNRQRPFLAVSENLKDREAFVKEIVEI